VVDAKALKIRLGVYQGSILAFQNYKSHIFHYQKKFLFI